MKKQLIIALALAAALTLPAVSDAYCHHRVWVYNHWEWRPGCGGGHHHWYYRHHHRYWY